MQEQSSSIPVRSTAAAAPGILPSRGISASLHPSMRPTTCFQGLMSLLGEYAFTLPLTVPDEKSHNSWCIYLRLSH